MSITLDKTLNEISYGWVAGYPKEEIRGGEMVVQHKYYCAWGDRLAFTKELLGYWQGNIFQEPHQYIAEGGLTVYNIYARNVSIKPIVSPSSDTNHYAYAEMEVEYGKIDWYYYPVPDDPDEPANIYGNVVAFSERIDPATEYLTLNRQGLYWGTGNDSVRIEDEDIETPTKIIKMIDWVFTRYRQRQIYTDHLDLIGKVNDTAIRPPTLGMSFPAETLLCGNVSAERDFTYSTFNSTMNSDWTVTYRFTYRNNGTYSSPKGWNHFPRTDNISTAGIQWERITDNTNNIPIYDTADFNTTLGLPS